MIVVCFAEVFENLNVLLFEDNFKYVVGYMKA